MRLLPSDLLLDALPLPLHSSTQPGIRMLVAVIQHPLPRRQPVVMGDIRLTPLENRALERRQVYHRRMHARPRQPLPVLPELSQRARVARNMDHVGQPARGLPSDTRNRERNIANRRKRYLRL